MRILSSELKNHIGKEVTLLGRLYAMREMGGITFCVVQDRKGLVQAVFDVPVVAKVGSIVSISGTVKEEKRAQLGVELAGKTIAVLQAPVEDLPFDLSKKELKVELPTLLDHRPITLRHETVRSIFKVYDTVLVAYAEAMRAMDFMEVKTPKILGAASEGGANFFALDYFGTQAFLAQSPQFYKQITAGVFERVFEVAPAFRAERHFTSRHVNEYISLDAEMAFIDDERDVMRTITQAVRHVCETVAEKNTGELALHTAEQVLLPKEIPAVPLAEMKRIIKEKYGHEVSKDTDIDPQGEVHAGQYAKEEFKSDFIFLTKYPREFRPFYIMPDPNNENETRSFDLLFRGVEIATGAQRIHDYHQLVDSMKLFRLNPDDFGFYLEAFKYAMPPHGGWGMGSERIVMKILGLASVKEAILFPRDVKRLVP
ncbi:MAG: aspartate--tRNA(Asn) ligase [Patescibacteria group bacterium]